MPELSVVIPLFNKASTVRRAIDSVRAQTLQAFELIVVNDGSTDAGPAIVRSIGDPRITLVDQSNAGVSAARNRGVDEARSDLVAFLDADDEWAPDFLETIVTLRRAHPSCGIFATSYWIRGSNDRRRAVLRGVGPGFELGVLRDYFRVAARSDPPVCSSALAISRGALAAIGGFPMGVATGEDLLTWARLAARHDVAYCVEPKATFWAPLSVSDRPGRTPQTPDRVADCLAELSTSGDAERVRGLDAYRAHWHEMRAVIFGSLGDGRRARGEARRALALRPGVKVVVLYLLSFLPLRSRALLLDLMGRARRVVTS